MPMNRLNATKVTRLTRRGRYGDGGGLWLQVSKWQTKSWLFQFTSPVTGKVRHLGLGRFGERDVSLQKARDLASDARSKIRQGIDPIEARRTERDGIRALRARQITFKEAAEKYVASHEPSWRNEKHRAQWRASLRTYANPLLGDLPVSQIDTELLTMVLEPIWNEKPETASRIRGRIESILDWSTARGYRTGENPARWKGHLAQLLPRPSKVKTVKHHPALPYSEISTLMKQLEARNGISARALEMTILTALRTGEIIGGTWEEIDLKAKIWAIPSARMKAGREHRVPLSDRTIAILKGLPREEGNPFVFIGGNVHRPISNMAMLNVLHEVRPGFTVHGFRSTFRDWAAERTSYENYVVEMALAHGIGNKVEAAYRRGDLFEKRQRLMADWAKHCALPPATLTSNVTLIKKVV